MMSGNIEKKEKFIFFYQNRIRITRSTGNYF